MRTSVRFGSILSNLIRDRMPYFEEVFSEVTSQYILYGYRKPLSTAYNGFILVQASRTQGRFAMEVGVTRGDTYPYHRLNDYPDIGFKGYREAVFTMLKNYNHSEEYSNAETLFKSLYSLLKDAEMAMSRLMERTVSRIQSTYDVWQQLYTKWLEIEQHASGLPGRRYPALSAEALAFEIIEEILTAGTFDRYLGPVKYRYRNAHFMNCHVYLLARGLEFLEPPDPPLNPVTGEPPAGKKVLAALDDPIAGLTGRLPQSYAVELSPATRNKTTQYAFLKSLGAVEALLQLDPQGNPVRSDGFQIFVAGAAQDLIEAPDYIDKSFAKSSAAAADKPVYQSPSVYLAHDPSHSASPSRESTAPAAPQSPENRVELKQAKASYSVDDDDDPIAMLESRLGLR